MSPIDKKIYEIQLAVGYYFLHRPRLFVAVIVLIIILPSLVYVISR